MTDEISELLRRINLELGHELPDLPAFRSASSSPNSVIPF